MIGLTPDFQRKAGIWSNAQQSRLIESLLLRIPIPSFYASELTDSSWAQDSPWAIVNGIQRLTAIARFIAPAALARAGMDFGPLRLRCLECLKDDFEGKGYDDLSGRVQIRLNESRVVVHLIRPGTSEEVKFNIFARINIGASRCPTRRSGTRSSPARPADSCPHSPNRRSSPRPPQPRRVQRADGGPRDGAALPRPPAHRPQPVPVHRSQAPDTAGVPRSAR
ncbi:DUF262 domain-containing protein [Streptomyces sp. NPDC015350]|uniref:DUF262 domain-containing protein n=1 Tax=Streptomyces sp. NPDC015350 TaxID=3364955 RepID=UPI0036FB333F